MVVLSKSPRQFAKSVSTAWPRKFGTLARGNASCLFTSSVAIILFFCFGLGSRATEPLSYAEVDASPEQVQFFESSIRPLLIDHCISCHGPQKQEGGLRVDSAEFLGKGGESGEVLNLNDPEASLLLSAVRHEQLQMPPTGKLPERDLAAITTWVRSGAVWPKSDRNRVLRPKERSFTQEDKEYWCFQPVKNYSPPDLAKRSAFDQETVTPPTSRSLDAFVLEQLQREGLSFSPIASKPVLLRRLYFDLIGVPPTYEEVQAFVEDKRDDAYARLVERLLDDPRYGQKWARHWLDLVRYAESDGFKQDTYRPSAYLYRDYVIDAFNQDLPYSQFIIEQLAGDEIAPNDPRLMAATGYLRLWIYEYNQRDVRGQWTNILNDLTDVTGEAFLGLSVGCARCHDHKFDPILQRDYYRLQAFFAPIIPKDDRIWASSSDLNRYAEKQKEWESATASIRAQIDEIEKPIRDDVATKAIDKFPPDIRPLLRKPANERSPLETQLADLAFRQVTEEWNNLDFEKKLTGETKARWQELKKQLDSFGHLKPPKQQFVSVAQDVGPVAPPTFIPGQEKDPESEISPGILSIIDPSSMKIETPDESRTTGRRLALARWIASPDNPLTARVMVNRIWQQHFGKGLVSNASDFGRLTSPPSHPALLDYLADEFVRSGWSVKQIHRLIVSSVTYRQASQREDLTACLNVDSNNQWLWRYAPRRLDAEAIRDAMLYASGELQIVSDGPSKNLDSTARSIFLKVIRNQPQPLLSALDAPDGSSSTAQRFATTTPLQALQLMNSTWVYERGKHLAERSLTNHSTIEEVVQHLYRNSLGRVATAQELERCASFLHSPIHETLDESKRVALKPLFSDLAHLLICSNEFLYIE